MITTDSNTPPFSPRIASRHDDKPNFPEYINSSDTANATQAPEQTPEIITAATIAAVDLHLASISLYPQSTAAPQRNDVDTARTELLPDVPVASQAGTNDPPSSMSLHSLPPPRGSILETLQKFGVLTETPSSSYPRAFRVVVATTVRTGDLLAPSEEMAIKLVQIRTAQ